MALIEEDGSVHARLLRVQAELNRTLKQYDSVVRTIGEVIYENEQYVKAVRDMIFHIHWEHPERATKIGEVTLARFGAETREEGEAQGPVSA